MPSREPRPASLRLAATLALLVGLLGRTAAAQVLESPSPVPSPVAAPLAPAGVIPANLSLAVSGTPVADAAFLDAQIRAAIDRAIRPTLRPGSAIRYGPIVPWPLLPLPSGTRAAVLVGITLAGGVGFADVSGTTTVTLNGTVVPPPDPAVLFLSDDPEYLTAEGLVFRGAVTPARAARLYYYHSDVGMPRDVDVVVSAQAPAQVALTEANAGPDLDVMSVGHTVTRDFLRYEQNDESVVVDIVPGTPLVVHHALLLQGEVTAGALDVQVLRGSGVTVSVIASAAGGRPEMYLAGPRVPYDGHHRHGTFDLAGYGRISQTYTVGGPAAAVQYGGRAPTPRNIDPSDDGRDYGDYGVVHRITLALTNPADTPQIVYLYEKPLGGPLRSSFIVDGLLKEMGCVRQPQPYWVATYQLPPHANGASTTVTMTDGGSFYPMEFGVSDAQPSPYTPPVGAADGCSPSTPAFPDPQAAGATVRH
ncbi:MAG TPA: hypothetical protein VGN14_02825 [Candidatus Elarobacter sp.]|jgi:hypothetical protein